MRRILLLSLYVLPFFVGVQQSSACPFCTAVSQTFSEEFETMDVVVLAKIEEVPESDDDEATPKATFRVIEIIKGDKWVEAGQKIVQTYYGDGNKERSYLITATDPPSLMWSSPLGLSDVGQEYVKKLSALPKDATRLEFFQDYLEHEDEMLARDSYDEFAKTPYEGVIALKDKMYHDRLIDWIKDVDVPATRRRLYFTMLGICGQDSDIKLLEEMMKSGDRKEKAGLDAMLACYLMLTKADGLPTVEELFLQNKDAEYADTYSAIMAIRFHGSETDVIDRTELVKALRHILERPNLADLVIPDLARWEDWEVMPRLVDLFKNADDKSSWVRVPVINYLRACPLPEAKEHISALEKVDPDAVRRAMQFFPFGKDDKKEDTAKSEDESSQPVTGAATSFIPQPIDESSFKQPLPPPEFEPATDTVSVAGVTADVAPRNESNDAILHADADAEQVSFSEPVQETREIAEPIGNTSENRQIASKSAKTALSSDKVAESTAANPWMTMSVPLFGGVLLYGVFRLILGLPLLGHGKG